MNKKTTIERTENITPYKELLHGAKVLKRISKEVPSGSVYTELASMVFISLTYEAFLNHVGENISKNGKWDIIERLPFEKKLRYILLELEIDFSKEQEPWQTLFNLKKFRDKIAHGRDYSIEAKETFNNAEQAEELLYKVATLEWQHHCDLKELDDTFKKIEEAIKIIDDKTNFPKKPLYSASMYPA